MSYTILYRSMFAKVGEDKYIPMIEIGDNNVFEGLTPHSRRARSWQNWCVPGFEKRLVLSRQEIIQGVFKLLEDYNNRYVNQPIDGDEKNGYWTYKSIGENFGWLSGIAVSGKHTTKTTARMVSNFFNRGFKMCFDMTSDKWLFLHTLPITLHHYDKDEPWSITTKQFDTIADMVEVLEKAEREGHDSWLHYTPTVEIVWNNLKHGII